MPENLPVKYAAQTRYEERARPKAAGFKWDPHFRVWWKVMTPKEAAAVSFRTAPFDEEVRRRDMQRQFRRWNMPVSVFRIINYLRGWR